MLYPCNILNFHFHFHSPFVCASFVLENGGISEWYTGVVHKTESDYNHLKHMGRHHFQSEQEIVAPQINYSRFS